MFLVSVQWMQHYYHHPGNIFPVIIPFPLGLCQLLGNLKCDEIPVPNPPTEIQSSSKSKSERIGSDGEHYQKEISNDTFKLFLQAQLIDLTKELNLSKEAAQILRSRLKK